MKRTVEKAPDGYIAPQEVVFEHGVDENGYGADGKKHFNIFDDSPEFIKRSDVLDPNSGDPVALCHVTNLEKGVYTVFSYHHKDSEFGTEPLSFNSVFYGTGVQQGKVKVNKIGFRHGSTWPDYQGAWLDFDEGQNASNYKNIGIEQTVNSLDTTTYRWLDEEYLVNSD